MNKILAYKLLFLVSFTFFQCTNKTEKPIQQDLPIDTFERGQSHQQDSIDDQIIAKGDYYFDTDEIIHYSLRMGTKPFDLIDKDSLTKYEQTTYDYFFGDFPKDIKHVFIKEIEARYFNQQLDSSKFQEVREIFREKKHKNNVEANCIPEYRDILIFKKNKEIVGLAKICFTCQQNYILGTSKNTAEFGQGGDYDRLRSILHH